MADPHHPRCLDNALHISCRGRTKLYNEAHVACMEISRVNAPDPALNHPHRRPASGRAKLASSNTLGWPKRWMFKIYDPAVEVSVGGQIAVRMPARFAGYDWEHYQPESVAAVVRWVKQNPRGVVLDVGRAGGVLEAGDSAGIYSLIAMSTGPQIEVIAFDPDLPNLTKVRRLCKYAHGARLRVVYGFIGGCTEAISLFEAITRTNKDLRAAAAWGGLGMMRFRASPFRPVPFRLLDDLFLQDDLINRPMLIRSHEQGGQLGVLAGGQQLLQRARPDLLLTVHPEDLRRFGHSRQDLQSLLEANNYEVTCLPSSYEEEWWCQVRPTNSTKV
jgi:FkbM family methyltransferase